MQVGNLGIRILFKRWLALVGKVSGVAFFFLIISSLGLFFGNTSIY
jgi:hypothetical protein